ncbi:MAG: LysR family transcriptional regulator [Pseudomonadales bacterium]|nr:LysR family transcriptional regulator [Pseudomonadales bacterium]MCP5173424.1 LysR family transcriptional regulator [Pseudomonadales bacterium]
MDNILALRTLVRVADSGSFSEVARQMAVAPSSVSRQVKDLENELGVQLFKRTTRKLSLTEAGQLLYERAERILLELDETRLAVTEGGAPSGTLKVTAPTAIARELLISVLPEFLQTYPGVQMVMLANDYVLDIVEAGVDVAIRVGRLSDSSLKARKLGDSKRVICASPEYLKKHGIPKHPKDLENHNCLTFRDQPGFNIWQFKDGKETIKVKATGNFFARGSDAMTAAALAGLGLISMPDWNMGVELKNKQLKVVLVDYPVSPPTSPVWAIHAHQRHVPAKVRVFIDFLVGKLAHENFS